MADKENAVQKSILDYLALKQVFHWRQNNGATYDAKLGFYRSHTGIKGVPDIICVIDGKFVGIECKTKSGRQSADQVLFQKRLEAAGGVYILARSVDDVIECGI